MSAQKRRQVNKSITQTQIAFPHTRGLREQCSPHKDILMKMEKSSKLQQSGAKDNSTPFRSNLRVQRLLKQSPQQAKPSSFKIIEQASPAFSLRKVGTINYESKPSSVTTASTQAYSEYSACKSDRGFKKRDVKKEKKGSYPISLVGQKRHGQQQLDKMEYFLRLHSKNAKAIVQNLKLRDKKTGQTYDFPLLQEDDLQGMRANPILKSFDMTKLEVEYDYDTDCEQLTHSKKMLLHELLQAIDFFIKEDPIKLVDNVLL